MITKINKDLLYAKTERILKPANDFIDYIEQRWWIILGRERTIQKQNVRKILGPSYTSRGCLCLTRVDFTVCSIAFAFIRIPYQLYILALIVTKFSPHPNIYTLPLSPKSSQFTGFSQESLHGPNLLLTINLGLHTEWHHN